MLTAFLGWRKIATSWRKFASGWQKFAADQPHDDAKSKARVASECHRQVELLTPMGDRAV
jgi:hypothetical protein